MDAADDKFIADVTALIEAYEEASNHGKIVGFTVRLVDIDSVPKQDAYFTWDGEKFREVDN